jgi:hypothetical protein
MQIGRAIKIITADKTEWPNYWAEENDRSSLMKYGITLIVAANIVKAIGLLIFTAGFAFMGGWAAYYLVSAAVSLILEIVALMFIPKIFGMLAPSFGGQNNDLHGLKLYVYAMTPVWIGALASFIPVLGWIVALAGGIYGIVLFWQHAGEAMGVPEDKKVGFVLVSALVIIVIYGIIGFIAGLLVASLAVGTVLSTGGWHRGY